MAADIVPDLLNRIMVDFDSGIGSSSIIKEVTDLIASGNADYRTATKYATEIGRILSGVLQKHVTSASMPDGRMYYNIAQRVMESTLVKDQQMVADVAAQVQAILNRNAKIGIKAIKPPVNQSRIGGFVERLANEPFVDDVAWILDEPIVNYSQAVVNEVMEANANFHMESGLEPTIERTMVGDTCDWCKEMVGVYKYADVKRTGHPVFRRHLKCDCNVVYNPGDGKRINVHTKEIAGSEADIIGQEKIHEKRIKQAELAAERRKAAKTSTKTKPQSEPTTKTLKKQYADTPPMNEFDYFSREQEQFRLKSIRDLAEVPDTEAKEMLKALSGESGQYSGVGNNVPKGWFSGSDTDIRNATSGEFFEKAKTIDSYIEKAPKYQGDIYRGLSLDDETIKQFKTGGSFVENGNISSWTSEKSVAQMFAEGRSEQMGTRQVIIQTSNHPMSTPASHLSIFGNEECEVLVSNMKSSEYLIESVSDKDGYVHIILKLMGK